MKTSFYRTLSNMAYTAPNDLGPILIHLNDCISSELCQQVHGMHAKERMVYDKHTNMNDVLKAQTIEVVDEVYLIEKHRRYTRYMETSSRNLIIHMLKRFGSITAEDLAINKRAMEELFDTYQDIDVFFKIIMDTVQYADDGKIHIIPDRWYRLHLVSSVPQDYTIQDVRFGVGRWWWIKHGPISKHTSPLSITI